jgi:Asp/Glu/hydantoin racemase
VLEDSMIDRFVTLGRYARATGADGILFTCSAFGVAIDAVKADLRMLPVLKPNEAGLEAALECGKRIALLATFAATIPSMTHELEMLARDRAIVPTIMTRVVDGALAALQGGDAERHDRLIREAVATFASADAIVLAQFSMARAAPTIPAGGRARIVTTPDSAVAKLRRLVEAN